MKEASYKVNSKEWRTISQESYSFHVNDDSGMTAADTLHLDTYNALIGTDGSKGVYEAKSMNFSTSHKLFKGAMKAFKWEELEVLVGPPKVNIKWRHWGVMSGNYRAMLISGRTVLENVNNKMIEVFGITTAEVDDQFRSKFLETFWDPDQIFRQLVYDGLEGLEALQKLKEGEKV